jgi:mannonate dehydratase
MKLGLGLYRHQLDAEHYRFAKQCGCTHLAIHLVDYFRSSHSNQPGDQPVGDDTGWGLAEIENLKTIIHHVGRADIPVFGYNFSIAGMAGRIKGKFARGEAEAVGRFTTTLGAPEVFPG